jgi:hypothetical protein
MKTYLSALLIFLVGCATTGMNVKTLREGMSRQQVISRLGNPDGMEKQGELEKLEYTNCAIPWSSSRADYYVILKDNAVIAYGTGKIRDSQDNVSWIVPLNLPGTNSPPMPPPPPLMPGYHR